MPVTSEQNFVDLDDVVTFFLELLDVLLELEEALLLYFPGLQPLAVPDPVGELLLLDPMDTVDLPQGVDGDGGPTSLAELLCAGF